MVWSFSFCNNWTKALWWPRERYTPQNWPALEKCINLPLMSVLLLDTQQSDWANHHFSISLPLCACLLRAWVCLCSCLHATVTLHVFSWQWKAVIRHSDPTVFVLYKLPGTAPFSCSLTWPSPWCLPAFTLSVACLSAEKQENGHCSFTLSGLIHCLLMPG